jgi:hypothetical protein
MHNPSKRDPNAWLPAYAKAWKKSFVIVVVGLRIQLQCVARCGTCPRTLVNYEVKGTTA